MGCRKCEILSLPCKTATRKEAMCRLLQKELNISGCAPIPGGGGSQQNFFFFTTKMNLATLMQ